MLKNNLMERKSGKKRNKIEYKTTMFSCLMLLLSLSSVYAQPQELDTSKIISELNTKTKLTLGYDNNITDQVNDRLKSRFYQIYINSTVNTYPTKKTLLLIKLQNAIKHIDSPYIAYESILINNLNFYLSQKIANKIMPELLGELRGRTSIHGKSDVLPSEEAFLRSLAEIALKVPIITDLSSRVFYNQKMTNFEDFDIYDWCGYETGIKTDIRLLPEASIGIQYSCENMSFSKWIDKIRKDKLRETVVSLQSYNNMLFNITYAHYNNSSNVNIYKYRGNKVIVLLGKSLPDDAVLQFYVVYRSENHQSLPEELTPSQIKLEDDEQIIFTTRVSKDVNKYCTIEAQYDLRRSKLEDKNRTRSSISLSALFSFSDF